MRNFIRCRVLLLAILSLAVSLSAQAQGSTAALPFQDLKLESKLMTREMPYRVILPAGYEKDTSERYAAVYLLHGLTGHFSDWADRTRLREYAGDHKFILIMPEGANGWYTDSASQPNQKYESYIIRELVPEIDKKYRTHPDRAHRAIAGLSMGGYGAIKFGLKYPGMFSLVGSFSGALGAATFNEGSLRASLQAIFGAGDSETRKENDIFRMIAEITTEKLKGTPYIYLDCGTEDFLYQNNRDFLDLLVKHKIPHEYRELPGGHNWTYWNSQVKEFLEVAQARLK